MPNFHFALINVSQIFTRPLTPVLLQEEEIIPAESLPVKQQQLLLGEADVASRQQVNEYEVATSRQVFFIVTFLFLLFFIVTFYCYFFYCYFLLYC